jgi:glutaminase
MNEVDLESVGKKNNGKEHTEMTLNITNNSWINTGLIALAQNLRGWFEDKVDLEFHEDYISISGREEELYNSISQALHNLAAEGTYNFSTAFKIINNDVNANYTKPKPYPDKKGDGKVSIEIFDSERKL